MKLRNIFNIILFAFIMIVPLIPIKYKVYFFPMSADFILGGLLIFVGILCVLENYINGKKKYEVMDNVYIKILSVVMAFFILLSIFSVSYASHKVVAISETIRFMEYALIFYLILMIVDELTVERCFKVFYFTMIFAALFGVAQFLFGWSSFMSDSYFNKGRIFSTFVNPNYWGAAINSVIFYPIVRLLDNKGVNRKIDLMIFLIFLFNLFFTVTRSSWLGFIIGLVLICLIRYRKKLWYILSLVVVTVLIPSFRNKLITNIFLNERLKLWGSGLKMFKSNLLKGVGNGNYIFNYSFYVKGNLSSSSYRPKLSVQNSYIKVLAELGIFGGIAFTVIYSAIFTYGYVIYNKSLKYRYIALSFVGFGAAYLFQNFFNNLAFIPQLNVFVWILGGLLIKGFYLEKNKDEQTS